jgi:hypothetical protein
MPLYRVTIRFGAPRSQYHIADFMAASLREALRLAADAIPGAVADVADLAEIRVHTDPEQRAYTPE